MANYQYSGRGLGKGLVTGSGHLQIAKQINGGVISSGLGTINLTSTGNVLGASPINIFTDEIETQNHVKRYEVFEIEEDLLLLSVVWQRMRKERDEFNSNGNIRKPAIEMPTNVVDKILFQNITPEDRTRTEIIRDYYHKKFMVWALSEIRLTNFREDLKKLIQSDGKVFKENMRPLAYRIPEFYDYDIMFDEMFTTHNTQVKQERQTVLTTKTFKLVKTVMRKRRHSSIKEFWFTDDNDNLNLLQVSKDNPLIKLMDHYSQNTFKIEGIFQKKIRDNREYCVVEKYSFL